MGHILNNAIQLRAKAFILCTAIIALAASICGFVIPYLILKEPLFPLSLLADILLIGAGVAWLSYLFRYRKQQNILFILALALISCSVILNRILRYSFIGIVVLFPAPILMCVLAIIDSIHGLKRKVFAIITILICMLSEVVYLKNFFIYGLWEWGAKYLPRYIGALSIDLSLLIFVINNRVIPLRKDNVEKRYKTIDKLPPEAALKQLKTDFEYGYITEEEYSTERTKIISKL